MRKLLFLGMLGLSIACRTTQPPDNSSRLSMSGITSVNNLVLDGQQEWLKKAVGTFKKKNFEHLVIFGDSLSDNGNLNKRTYGIMIPPNVFWKSRASNGPIWQDYVASALELSVTNYAVFGAKTRGTSIIDRLFIPSSQEQINEFIKSKHKPAFDKTLVVLWIGPNNYLSGDNDKAIDVINDISIQIKELHQIGVKYLFVGTMPELANLPQTPARSDRKIADTLSHITVQHNTQLGAKVASLQKELDDMKIIVFHGYDINQDTIDNKEYYGFADENVPCYQGDNRGNFKEGKSFCSDYFKVKFWDKTHPNSKMHCYYASQFLADAADAGFINNFELSSSLARCHELSEKR